MVRVGRLHPSLAERSAQEKSADASMPVRAPTAATLALDIFDFAPQALATASQPNTATLTNTSNSTVRIRDILASGIDFTETDTCMGTPPRERTVLSGLHSRLRSPVLGWGPSSSPIPILPVVTFWCLPATGVIHLTFNFSPQ